MENVLSRYQFSNPNERQQSDIVLIFRVWSR